MSEYIYKKVPLTIDDYIYFQPGIAPSKNKISKSRPNSSITDFPAPKMLTIKEVAKHTGISEHHIRQLCKTNKIQYIKTGVKYLINYDRFIDYLNGAL